MALSLEHKRKTYTISFTTCWSYRVGDWEVKSTVFSQTPWDDTLRDKEDKDLLQLQTSPVLGCTTHPRESSQPVVGAWVVI